MTEAGPTHSFTMLRRWPFLVYVGFVVLVALMFIAAGDGVDNLIEGIVPLLIGVIGVLFALVVLGRFVILPIFERRQFKQNVAMQDEQTATIDDQQFTLGSARGKSVYRWDECQEIVELTD